MSVARRFGLFAGVAAMLSSLSVYALGVGNLTLKSTLNQRLDARIDLLGVAPRESEQISVGLAAPEQFDKLGIENEVVLQGLRFSVERDPSGDWFIHVTSQAAVREPFLSFLLEVNWPAGRVMREFTVLLDPPVVVEQAPGAIEAPETGPPTRVVLPEPPSLEPADVAVPPATFSDRSLPPAARTDELVYTTQRGDALWRIAKDMRPDGVTIEQMMLALYRDNPQAFFGNNVSKLKAGQVLRLRDAATIAEIDVADAAAEIQRQHEEWLATARRYNRNTTVLASNDTRVTPDRRGGGGKSASMDNISRLQLVTPVAKDGETAEQLGSSGANGPDIEHMRNDLALAIEAVEASRKENTSLQQRVGALEKQVASMQRLIELKDQELRALQGRHADEKVYLPQGTTSVQVPLQRDSGADGGAPPSAQVADAKPWADATTIATALGAVAVLGLLAWLVQRRRAANEFEFADAEMPAPAATQTAERVRPSGPSLEIADTGRHEGVSAMVGDIDPVAEADVYIAYGRYDKAKDLMRTAIAREPDRHELRLKLLEILFAANESDAYAGAAEELYAALGGRADPLWERAVEMGRELCAGNPLFGAAGDAPASAPGAPFTRADGVSATVNYERLGETNASHAQPGNGRDHDEASYFLFSDEVGTKLDLARAYIEMGDRDAAREILDEVMVEGDDIHRQEAKDLIALVG